MSEAWPPLAALPATIALVPLKDLGRAKSRLAPLLPPPDRRELALSMAQQVLRTLQHLPHLREIWLVSPDPAAAALASTLGVRHVFDPTTDLNAALEVARTAAEHAGAEALLVLPGDVPLASAADIAALLDGLLRSALVIAPDAAEEGTNALALRLPSPLRFRFEGHSFARHIHAAEALGVPFTIYRSPTLALDVDTPEGYARYRERA